MEYAALPNGPLVKRGPMPKQRFRLNAHHLLLSLCVGILAWRMWIVFQGGGWEDRTQFFLEGELRPNLIDFFFNELMVPYLIIHVITFRTNPLVYALLALSAFAYYTRTPLILLIAAILFTVHLPIKYKIVLGIAAFSLSGFLLYLRIGASLWYFEESAAFFFTYPFVGIGRLIETQQIFDPTALQYIGLLIKPVDAALFTVDYAQDYGGQLSPGRFVGMELTYFVYIQALQGGYNAFGTVLYPFILIAGWFAGPFLFILFVVLQYLMYRFATQNEILSRRFIYVLLGTGLLFSWTSPFVWLAPFLFTKFTNRRRQ